MREIVYLEVPTPDTNAVCRWLQHDFSFGLGQKFITPDGINLQIQGTARSNNQIPNPPTFDPTTIPETDIELGTTSLQVFVWSVQRTTYLKVFCWQDLPIEGEKLFLENLISNLRKRFPQHYPIPPAIDLSKQSIFEALAPYYPQTVRFFQKMPNGEYDLNRVYWWEQRWREGVRNPQKPRQVIFKEPGAQKWKQEKIDSRSPISHYDLIYIGGALGVIHAAVMAQLGYRVLLMERLPFGRMNREWNISRDEFQSLIDLGLFTPAEFESVIAKEYIDGFHKFFDGNNPPHLRSAILHTPTVLNVGLDAEKLLQVCGQKLLAAGGEIWDETEFIKADIQSDRVVVEAKYLPDRSIRQANGRLLVDAMGTASPIAWQLNGGRTFDSVCPTVGAVLSGFEPGVWDANYGDVLNSHGDISRGRQLIWELFPASGEDITIYLFHYHQVHPDNPGSLLEMYEDFFTILPEYRRCDLEQLVWKKPTFGYIPGHFTTGSGDRTVAFDRLTSIGDAASLQSPLVFTGFGSLVRNLSRLTELLDTALKHNLLSANHLNQIRAYQSNVSVTWLFSKGMMVPTGRCLPPQRVNAMLNTFFGVLASEPPPVADAFIKDRIEWLMFNRLALKAAKINPALIVWIWDMAGGKDIFRWLGSYLNFTFYSLVKFLLAGWFPSWTRSLQPELETRFPAFWLWLLNISYVISPTMKRSSPVKVEERGPKTESLEKQKAESRG